MLEDRLTCITRVQSRLQERLNRLPAKSPDRRQLSEKLYHATTIARLLRAELGIGPVPTHSRTGFIGGVKVVMPEWEVKHA